MRVAAAALFDGQTVVAVERQRVLNFFTRHKSFSIADFRLPIEPLKFDFTIGIRQLAIGNVLNGSPTPAAFV
jgi:hypothetical protein